MEKPADTDIKLTESVSRRWSPCTFAETPVSKEHLHQLLEAARWASSCYNAQPWSFIIGTQDDSATFKKLSDCLEPGNRDWAAKAPVMMLALAELNFVHNGKPNKHAQHDLGLALGNLLNQATMLGLQAHLMAGFSIEKAREYFDLPETHDPVTMLVLGHPGEREAIPEELRERELAPRTRKTLDQIAFAGSLSKEFFK
ncbi:MAG: nitroreductase family protein [SAR324 cluster bacterium]|nr:nitroreductase family protein [SAR324 cluster bacterium]MBL7034455.1 nitroreductase family protein [SAR324 cluster bacterium]